jgi:hypothetical protein
MSGAPIIIGIIQFARPTKARHDGAEHHHQAVQRGHLVEERRLHELHAGLEQLRADDHGKAPPRRNMAKENHRYIVPMSLWLVVNSQRLMPFAGPCAIVRSPLNPSCN